MIEIGIAVLCLISIVGFCVCAHELRQIRIATTRTCNAVSASTRLTEEHLPKIAGNACALSRGVSRARTEASDQARDLVSTIRRAQKAAG